MDLPSRRSLRSSAPQPDASDEVLRELQRQAAEVKAQPGAGTGELRRDRNRLRGHDPAEALGSGVQAWVDTTPLDSLVTTTTGSISLPPVALPPVTPPPMLDNSPVLARSTGQVPLVEASTPLTSQVSPSSHVVRSPARTRRRGFAARLATLTAMIFVGGMAVATSIPADALLTAEDVAQRAEQSQEAGAMNDIDGQSVVASGTDEVVGRDNVSVTSGFKMSSRQSSLTYVNNPNALIQWPFHVTVPISDGFGYRDAPCNGCSTDHKGVDFDPGEGAPVMNIADGTVTQVIESYGGLGFQVHVTHNVNGLLFDSWYCHLKPGSITVVQGQQIKLGEIVGQVGDTGLSTGAHLHLEIHVNQVPVDPYAFLVQYNV